MSIKNFIFIGGSEKDLLRAVKSGVAEVVSWERYESAPALKLIDVLYRIPANGEDSGRTRCLVSSRIARKMGLDID